MDPVRETLLEWFKEEVGRVWGDRWVQRITFELGDKRPQKEDSHTIYAAVVFPLGEAGAAVGRTLLEAPARVELRIADELATLDPAMIKRILTHEAVHLGYPHHGKSFLKLVQEVGGVVSGSEVEGAPIRIQKKVGARYQTVREFPRGDMEAAAAWGREQARAEPGSRWRMLGDLDGRRKEPSQREQQAAVNEAANEANAALRAAQAGRLDEAKHLYRSATKALLDVGVDWEDSASYEHLDRLDEAAQALEEVNRLAFDGEEE